MPKRSNPEQRLVRRIYQAIEATGGTVLESQERCKAGLKKKREIDILIERTTFGVTTRVAVEVRARNRKEDVTWIDNLIGKYKKMDVEKIIAVSTSGFTDGALEQAGDEGIETLTLADAEAFDWPGQFTRIGICRVVRNDIPISFHLFTDPQVPEPVDEELPVSSELAVKCTLKELLAEVYQHARMLAGRKFDEMYKHLTLADIKEKVILMWIPVPVPRPCYLHMPDGSTPKIQEVGVRLDIRFEVDVRRTQHFVFGRDPLVRVADPLAMASVAQLNLDGVRCVTLVQTPDKPGTGKVFFEPQPAGTSPIQDAATSTAHSEERRQ